MPRSNAKQPIERILDANLNRTKEGLRVCEEFARFILNDAFLTREFKDIRHRVSAIALKNAGLRACIDKRDTGSDPGTTLHHPGELTRKNAADIFRANIQRVKESARVLEEFSKLQSARAALEFKKIRYRLYVLEQKTVKRLI